MTGKNKLERLDQEDPLFTYHFLMDELVEEIHAMRGTHGELTRKEIAIRLREIYHYCRKDLPPPPSPSRFA
jgi:hypothetical protein